MFLEASCLFNQWDFKNKITLITETQILNKSSAAKQKAETVTKMILYVILVNVLISMWLGLKNAFSYLKLLDVKTKKE